MSRCMLSGSLFLVMLVPLSFADSVSLVLEMEGTLVRSDSGFVLKVEGDSDWKLEFADFSKDSAKRISSKYASAKVWLKGSVRVNASTGTLQLRDRTVQVDDIFPFLPSVKITSVAAGLPAHKNGLRMGDMIHELNGKEITSEEQLRDSLNKLRGKTVSLLVSKKRPDDADVLETISVSLNENGPPLGINAKTEWKRGTRGGSLANPPPAP
jgi:membrane-associated protease RseP (regulator of RpoE activity)